MHANIGKGLDRRIALTNHEYRCIDNVPAQEVTLTWNLCRAAEADPVLAKQVFPFEFKNFGTMINAGWQALRIVERCVCILCQ